MAHRIQRNRRRASNRLIGKIRHKQLLDNVLALDRQVIEASMRTYGIPVRERLRMRAENRRLHRALKRIRFGGKAYV
jgi:hypothetical protein